MAKSQKRSIPSEKVSSIAKKLKYEKGKVSWVSRGQKGSIPWGISFATVPLPEKANACGNRAANGGLPFLNLIPPPEKAGPTGIAPPTPVQLSEPKPLCRLLQNL